jgi:hypothetical protein
MPTITITKGPSPRTGAIRVGEERAPIGRETEVSAEFIAGLKKSFPDVEYSTSTSSSSSSGNTGSTGSTGTTGASS